MEQPTNIGSGTATGDGSPPLLQLVGVTKRFGGVVAVRDVDFELRPGEVHALVGENGAGKSTLMKIADGLYAPDEGRLEVGGQPAEFSSPRDAEAAGIAMIPQELDLFPELSVAENLFVGRKRPRTGWGGLDWETMRGEARKRLDDLGVGLDATSAVKRLSAAEQQIVAIARALVGEARAVIMDEPTSSLTERETRRLFGAGRTELAQSIFGIRHPDSGEIFVDGEEARIPAPQTAMERGIFYVPEERRSQGLILPFSIKNNITLSILDRISRLGFVSRSERGIADRFMEELSIRGAEVSDPVNRLSGGNQQKVVVAKSLAREPNVLLLDEPTRGVDVGAKSEIYRLMDDLAKEGKAILLISSELEEVLSMADRVLVMREGRISGEFSRREATQESVMTAATGGTEQEVSEDE